MAGNLTQMQRQIRQYLFQAENFQAPASQIASALNSNVRSINQSLGAMRDKGLVIPLDVEGDDTVWRWKTFLNLHQ